MASTEWVGGTITLPEHVRDEAFGAPFKPESVVWVDIASGLIVGQTLLHPSEVGAEIGRHLRETIREAAEPPTVVRIASRDLADALARDLGPGTAVVCAPTPELDEVGRSLFAWLDARSSAPKLSYFGEGVDARGVAGAFRAAAQLYRSAPWDVVPSDRAPIRVVVPALGVREGVLVVIGQAGESLGFLFFESVEAWGHFLAAAAAMGRGGPRGELSRYLALNFHEKRDLEPGLRAEIAKHRWEIAGPRAYPWIVAVEDAVVACAPSAREMEVLEALCAALTELVDRWRASGAAELLQTRVATHRREIDVVLEAVEIDESVSAGELLEMFAASPEAARVRAPLRWTELVMHLAESHFGASLAEIEGDELAELLFASIPEKVVCEPREADEIVEELRAFFTFARRELEIADADGCLALLGRATERLRRALTDSRSFGPAKSIFRHAAPPAAPARRAAARQRMKKQKPARAPKKKNR